MISIIVAHDEDRAIAKDGKIPWYISEDFKHFKATTMDCPVVMGRVTWDSLPVKPLPLRTNVVISSQKDYTRLAFMAQNLDEALSIATRERPDKDIFIIGGLQIYKEALASGIVDKVVSSHIKGHFGGDMFFPELNGWQRRLIKSFNDFEVYEYTNY